VTEITWRRTGLLRSFVVIEPVAYVDVVERFVHFFHLPSQINFRLGAVIINSNADCAHRLNNDGTFDSICLRCYLTVTTASTEPELVFGEAQHLCPPDSPLLSRTVENLLRQLTRETIDDGAVAR
jgi:hypothetical protein